MKIMIYSKGKQENYFPIKIKFINKITSMFEIILFNQNNKFKQDLINQLLYFIIKGKEIDVLIIQSKYFVY